jgi:hypothetical protein
MYVCVLIGMYKLLRAFNRLLHFLTVSSYAFFFIIEIRELELIAGKTLALFEFHHYY